MIFPASVVPGPCNGHGAMSRWPTRLIALFDSYSMFLMITARIQRIERMKNPRSKGVNTRDMVRYFWVRMALGGGPELAVSTWVGWPTCGGGPEVWTTTVYL
ncbi:hypothetical protein GE21DRAFT_1033968 [Neurospora crassa]|nr:hypothetical protein GE21DRAFT_1033968 [Neurospora crassa]